MPAPAPPEDGLVTCDSCGAAAADTAPVHRVYVTPRAWDLFGDQAADADEETGGEGAGGDTRADHVEVVDEVERWCFPCRSQYPHQPLVP
jgi:hypothetical protein